MNDLKKINKKKRSICIIHPEGNIHNNPNLSGIVEILSEKGFEIYVISLKNKNIFQGPCLSNTAELILHTDKLTGRIKKYFTLLKRKYDFLIGVDAGILEANKIGNLRNIPVGLISYEIMFADEVSIKSKKKEIKACQSLDFAVCQDSVRANQLSLENKIPLKKIIHIPVAGRSIVTGDKNSYLHRKLQIPLDKKIALFTGAVAKRSMIGKLLDSTATWPEDWVLVVHNRYGMNKATADYYHKYKSSQNIYFSRETCDTLENLKLVLKSADIGIALFKPIYDSPFNGKNIEYLGMSSGKIATYLQHGLPIMVNQVGEMSDYVNKYSIGFTISNTNEIPDRLSNYKELRFYREKCYSFFKEKLDLNITITKLLKKLY